MIPEKAESNANLRAQKHRDAHHSVCEGNYDEAVRTLEDCIATYGSHVGVRSELAFAYYLQGDFGGFRFAVEKLESEFSEFRDILSAESRIRTQIALAKFYEELGCLSRAFDAIEEVIRLAPLGSPLRLKALCQKLRLCAGFAEESELSRAYQDCLQVMEKRPNLLIECFHALILAESRLFGFQAIWPRLQDLAQRQQLQAADLRLVAFDLLEFCIERREPSSVTTMMSFIAEHGLEGEADFFEQALLKIARAELITPSADDYFQFTRRLAPMGQLRVLALCAESKETRRRFSVFIDAFDSASRKRLWMKWGRLAKPSVSVDLIVKQDGQILRWNERELSFKKGSQNSTLVAALCKADSQLSPTHILCLMGRDDSPHNRESLRINLLRLNKALSSFVGAEWVVRYGKQQIQTQVGVRFLPS